MDPIDFLLEHEPFLTLDAAGRARVARTLEVVYARRGDVLLERGGERSGHLWIVRKGSVRLDVDGQTVDVLGEGELFGFPSLLSRGAPQFTVIADSDCLLYRIPDAVFQQLIQEQPGFGEFFLENLASRLRLATERKPASLSGDLGTPVGRLSASPPVSIDPSRTVGEAARTMRERRISSVLVRGEPLGILTDRDLRSRVLAEDLGPDVPVADVMTAPAKTFPAEAPLLDALLFLLRERIHHLPLVRNGEVVGLITHTDLLRHHLKSPGYLAKKIDKLSDPQDLAGYAGEIAGMVEALDSSGLEATEIGRIVASLNDALVQRIIRCALRELGTPPCAYRWIVFGSEGRREQALITDQDNALVYEEDSEEARDFFAALAQRVVQGLIAASFPPCQGGFMATNWHRPLAEWERLFERWTRNPEPKALMEAANFFDYRGIDGELDLSSLEERIREGAKQKSFLGHLARTVLSKRPPLGIFHRIREDHDGIDLKAGGLMPIVGLARVHALEVGSAERSTLGRLEAATRGGSLSADGAETTAEGFRFLFRLRLSAQLRAVRKGQTPDNNVHLDDLTALERRHLKETFLHVRLMQEAMSQRYSVSMLG